MNVREGPLNEQLQNLRALTDSYNMQVMSSKAAAGEDENIGKWELDVEPFLDRIYNELLGNSQDKDGAWKRDLNKHRMLNEQGASDFINELSARVSIHMQFSDLEKEDIVEIASETAENFGDKIEDNWKNWEVVQTYSNYEAIGMKLFHSLYILLRIAKAGGMKKHREKSRNPYMNVSYPDENRHGLV